MAELFGLGNETPAPPPHLSPRDAAAEVAGAERAGEGGAQQPEAAEEADEEYTPGTQSATQDFFEDDDEDDDDEEEDEEDEHYELKQKLLDYKDQSFKNEMTKQKHKIEEVKKDIAQQKGEAMALAKANAKTLFAEKVRHAPACYSPACSAEWRSCVGRQAPPEQDVGVGQQ